MDSSGRARGKRETMLLRWLVERIDSRADGGAQAHASLGLPFDNHTARMICLLEGPESEDAIARAHVSVQQHSDAVTVHALFTIHVLLEVLGFRRQAQSCPQVGHFQARSGGAEEESIPGDHRWPG